MAMDFFEHQEQAKRRTGVLVVMFVVAVVFTVLGTFAALAATIGGGKFANPQLFLGVSAAVLAIIGIGTAIKFAQMAGGGRAVAAAMGGTQIDPATRDPDERRALNVVEEMAIASGVPVPPVYLIDDDSINAFAAGNGPRDSVVGLTRGCVQQLTRDELQGVVAHEFSHIFHQDTRLNMRLVAWLGGLMAMSLVGQVILRSLRFSSGRGKNNPVAVIMLVALVLFVLGIVGYFFGRLIQSAVSRQREYLADASAVQYTRNPDGIAGALEKISTVGSRLRAPSAPEFSHFFFAAGIGSLFATHPPLEERIRRIRGLAGAMPPAAPRAAAGTAPGRASSTTPAGAAAFAGAEAATRAVSDATPTDIPATAVRASRDAIGTVSSAQLARASRLLGDIPPAFIDAAREPFSARAVVCALLLDRDAAMMSRQLTLLAGDPDLRDAVADLHAVHPQPRAEHRLPLVEIAASSLALLSPAQLAAFRTALTELIAADGQVDRVEWTVRVVLRRAIEGRGAAPAARARAATTDDAALVVSVLAWSGASDAAAARRAWSAARTAAPLLPAEPAAPARCTLDALDDALGALDAAPPRLKRVLVDACVASVAADGRTTVEEAELLRAVCDSIGVPMPPIAAS
jgi:Zn-dependent protease with chaperone function